MDFWWGGELLFSQLRFGYVLGFFILYYCYYSLFAS